VADSLICVSIPSLVAAEFPAKNELYQGYLNAAMGFGLTLGPLLSSAVYGSLGYTNTFYFYAGFIAFFGLGTCCFMPKRLDNPDVKHTEEKKSESEETVEEVVVPYSVFFKERRSVLSQFVGASIYICLLYNSPTLANELVKQGMSKANSGFGMATCWTMYAIGGFVGGPLCPLLTRRYTVLLTILIAAGANILIGPSSFLDLPDKTYYMFIGLALLGFAIGINHVPMIPEITEPVQLRYGIPLVPEEGDSERPNPTLSKICDKGAVLYSVSYCFAGVIAPILGGFVYDKVGYRSTSDLVVCFALLLFVVYFIVGILLHKKIDEDQH